MKLTRIYKIVDINNKCYIGKTHTTIKKRFYNHKYDKKHDNRCSSKQLDLDNCIVIELKVFIPKNRQELKDIEASFIRSCPNSVNINLKFG
jgi:hypothetical protein